MDLLTIVGLISVPIVLLIVTLPRPRGNHVGPANPTPGRLGHIDLFPRHGDHVAIKDTALAEKGRRIPAPPRPENGRIIEKPCTLPKDISDAEAQFLASRRWRGGNHPGPDNPTPPPMGPINIGPRKPKPAPIHVVIDCRREVRRHAYDRQSIVKGFGDPR